MAFNLQKARAAGKSDTEIADYLAGATGFKIDKARAAGKSDSEIAEYLSLNSSKPAQPNFEINIDAMRAEREAAKAQQEADKMPDATALQRVQAGGAGFNRGVINLAGLPVDTAANIVDLAKAGAGFAYGEVTGEPPPEALQIVQRDKIPLSSEWLAKKAQEAGAGVTAARPDDAVSRLLYAGGQGAASVIPATAGATASQAAQLAKQGVASAVAGQSTAELTDSPEVGTAVSMAWPVVPAVGRAVADKAKAVSTPLTANGRELIAGKVLRDLSDEPGYTKGLESPDTPIPGTTPTTGQAMGTRRALMVEKSMRQTPEGADRFGDLDTNNAAVRNAYVEDIAPGRNGAATLKESISNRVNNEIAAADARASSAIAETGPVVSLERAGQVIRQAHDEGYNLARQATSKGYKAKELVNSSVILPTQKIDQAIQEIYGKLGRKNGAKPLDALIKPYLGQGGRVPWLDYQSLRKQVSAMAYKEAQGDRTLSAAASRVLSLIDDAPLRANNPKQAGAFSAAKQLRVTQGERFETGASAKMNQRGSGNIPRLEDVDVPPNFLNGSPEDAAQFLRSVGSNPAALQAGQNYVAQKWREAISQPTGHLKSGWRNASAGFIQKMEPVLNVYPDLRGKFNSAVLQAEKAEDVASRLQTGVAKHFLKANDPENALKAYINSPNRKAESVELTRMISTDRAAKEALAVGVREHIQTLTPSKALSFLKDADNQRWLERSFDSETLGRWRKVAADFEREAKIDSVRTRGSDTSQNIAVRQHVANSGLNFFTRLLANFPGREAVMSVGQSVAKAATADAQTQLDALKMEAMLDPKLAARLMQKATPAAKRDITEWLKVRAAILGTQAAEQSNESAR